MTLLRSEKERRTGLGRDMMQRAESVGLQKKRNMHAKSCPPRPAILSPLAICWSRWLVPVRLAERFPRSANVSERGRFGWSRPPRRAILSPSKKCLGERREGLAFTLPSKGVGSEGETSQNTRNIYAVLCVIYSYQNIYEYDLLSENQIQRGQHGKRSL